MGVRIPVGLVAEPDLQSGLKQAESELDEFGQRAADAFEQANMEARRLDDTVEDIADSARKAAEEVDGITPPTGGGGDGGGGGGGGGGDGGGRPTRGAAFVGGFDRAASGAIGFLGGLGVQEVFGRFRDAVQRVNEQVADGTRVFDRYAQSAQIASERALGFQAQADNLLVTVAGFGLDPFGQGGQNLIEGLTAAGDERDRVEARVAAALARSERQINAWDQALHDSTRAIETDRQARERSAAALDTLTASTAAAASSAAARRRAELAPALAGRFGGSFAGSRTESLFFPDEFSRAVASLRESSGGGGGSASSPTSITVVYQIENNLGTEQDFVDTMSRRLEADVREGRLDLQSGPCSR